MALSTWPLDSNDMDESDFLSECSDQLTPVKFYIRVQRSEKHRENSKNVGYFITLKEKWLSCLCTVTEAFMSLRGGARIPRRSG